MRLRADSFHIAGWKRAHQLLGCDCPPPIAAGKRLDGRSHVAHLRKYRSVKPAELGDVWVLHNSQGAITGYALTCPKEDCRSGVHPWDHAYNCEQRTDPVAPPCWQWSGSIEEDTLTATPSLHVLAELGGCGWHGWLRNGQMVPA